MKPSRVRGNATAQPKKRQARRASAHVSVGKKNWIKIRFDSDTMEKVRKIARERAGTLSTYARQCVQRDYLERTRGKWSPNPVVQLTLWKFDLKALTYFHRHHLHGYDLEESVEAILRVALMYPKQMGQLLGAVHKYCEAEGLEGRYNRMRYAEQKISTLSEYQEDDPSNVEEEED